MVDDYFKYADRTVFYGSEFWDNGRLYIPKNADETSIKSALIDELDLDSIEEVFENIKVKRY